MKKLQAWEQPIQIKENIEIYYYAATLFKGKKMNGCT